MLTYCLRERLLQFDVEAKQHYPSEAEVCVALEPAAPFGGVPGESRSVVADRPLCARIDLSTGRSTVSSDAPLFAPLDTSVVIAGTTFILKQNVVTVRSVVSSPQ